MRTPVTKVIGRVDTQPNFIDSFTALLRTALRYVEYDLDAKGKSTLTAVAPRVLRDPALRRWRNVLSDTRVRCVISTCVRMGAWNESNIVLRNGVGFTRRVLKLVK